MALWTFDILPISMFIWKKPSYVFSTTISTVKSLHDNFGTACIFMWMKSLNIEKSNSFTLNYQYKNKHHHHTSKANNSFISHTQKEKHNRQQSYLYGKPISAAYFIINMEIQNQIKCFNSWQVTCFVVDCFKSFMHPIEIPLQYFNTQSNKTGGKKR